MKISTRSGPSTKYQDTGTYDLAGQYLEILARAYDNVNKIWWVKCVIPTNGRELWTGYKRFDQSTLPLERITIWAEQYSINNELPYTYLIASLQFSDDCVADAARAALGLEDLPVDAEDLANIVELTLDNVGDLSDLASMTGLKHLNISYFTGEDLTPLAGLTRMKTLSLICSDWPTDLTPLAGLTNLEELSLNINTSTTMPDLMPLVGMTRLRRLDLSHPNSDVNGHGQIANLTPLGRLGALEELDLHGNNMPDLSGLAGLTGLRSLNICNCCIEDLSALSTLTGLEELNMGDWVDEIEVYGPVDDLSCLTGLTHLKKLELFDQGIDDLSPLSGLTDLEELDISGTKVNDLKPLSGLTNLRKLNISRTQVEDLTPLSKLLKLSELDMWETQVEDLSPLDGLPELIKG